MQPKHSPPQQSIVLKFVPNYITNEEIKNEIGSAYKSIYNLEKMKGSMMEKSRHIRLALTCSDEYKKIINSNGLTLNEQVMEVNEFLASPRLLIYSKCNDPEHIRRNCLFQYDACRRCGNDRSTGEYRECTICCHRCKQSHLSTDFKCSLLINYRRSLLYRLKEKPNLLPPNIQLFISTECRAKDEKYNKILINTKNKLNSNNMNTKQIVFNHSIFHHN
ncbi:unnamed protein product [Rotaria socialis]|uniref:Uncharacterized protein n=1 Tax=Rotaria socialis TaxID=392032 RepID=A0A818ZWD9_9BILA|nr:unnamed protein product [Rotaria socialis]CAF4715468.1 unnamed protein product [Rotaria socialis]